MDFPRVTTQLIVLVIVVAALDQCSLHLRRCPRGLLLLAPLGAYAAIHYSPQLLGAAHAARVFAEMLPPQLRTEQFGALARQRRDTIRWEDRRVGKECVRTSRSRGSPFT